MKKRYFVNGKSVMMAVSMVAALSVWGCGSNEGTGRQSADEMAEQTETGDWESTMGAVGDGENAGERKGEGEEDAGEGKKNVEEGVQDVDEAGTAVGIEEDRMEDGETGEQIVLAGVIQKVEDGSFVMEQLRSEVDESTGLVMVGGDPESPGVVVDYTKDTVFVRRVTTDGITGTDEPGTEQDLGKDALVDVTGIWREDRFLAEEISVFMDARK